MPEATTHDIVPRPDPTTLTTEQLRRELSTLREILETRLDAMDKASELLHANLTTVVFPHDLHSLKDTLISLVDKSDAVNVEKFSRIETQFTERDKRAAEAKTAADTGIAAAMAAAEKVTNKSETTTGEALKSLDSQLKTEIRATNDKVSMIASRQDRNDGSNATLIAIGSAAAAAMAIIIAGYSAFHTNAPVPTVSYVPAPTAAIQAPVTVPR